MACSYLAEDIEQNIYFIIKGFIDKYTDDYKILKLISDDFMDRFSLIENDKIVIFCNEIEKFINNKFNFGISKDYIIAEFVKFKMGSK